MMDRKKIAFIHIVKKELALSDDEYREILKKVAGVRSSKDLNEAGFRKLVNYLVRSKHYRLNGKNGLTLRQKLYMQYLARELDWEQSHLENFIRKYYHRELTELSRKDAVKAIESLKNVKAHQKAA